MSIITLTEANFDQVIDDHEIVVIDFWANWCQPCLAFAETFKRVAEQFPAVTFAKVDVEQETQLATDFSVRSIPLLVILKQQVIIFAESGSLPEATLVELVEQAQALDMSKVETEDGND
jgi:thioredoxin 1